MKQSVRKSMVGVVAATSVLALTTATAHATGQGLTTTQDITLTNSGNVSFRDNATGWGFGCTNSIGTGTADVDAPQASPVFRITSLTLTSPYSGWNGRCEGFFPQQVTADTTTPWAFNVTGSTVSYVTPGTLTGVKLTIVGGDACHVVVGGPGGAGGTLSANYSNSAHSLNINRPVGTNNLTVQSVDNNCDPTFVNVGDAFSMFGTYPINPRITIIR
ncbi:hypothetical protein [Actinomadura harenae]|uniref:Secreted protein n=1 Tax=Actinomadura harenae TaxID=2483351 RepID=A0A3M2MAV1_9ACTN|nr:hypothetical protein [Actinomadura harenae]RMI46619.1 hypothetical protein EBO15_06760 [Actinomadura harenae]